MALTKKQKLVLDFITDYIEVHTFSPTQEEIRTHFQLKSLGSVQRYLKYLANEGYIELEWNARRGIKLASPELNHNQNIAFLEVPLLGDVAAGSPIEAIERPDVLEIPNSLLSRQGDYFALTVKGDSMIEDGIFEGDTILVRQDRHVRNGQTVVVQVEDSVTVKKFFKKKGIVELHPANSTMDPIIVEEGELTILGHVAGLMRSYE